MAVRFFGQILVRPILLALAFAPAAGCWTDIPYNSTAESESTSSQMASQAGTQPLEEPPVIEPISDSVANPATNETTAEELFSDIVVPAPPPQTTGPPALDEPTDRPRPAPEPVAIAEPAEEESMVAEVEIEPVDEISSFDELFGTPAAQAKPEPAPSDNESPPEATPSLLPWEIDAPTTVDSGQADAEFADAEFQEQQPLSWVEPRPRDDDEPVADEPAAIEIESSAELGPAREFDSRQLTWQLASRLSYVVLAPDVAVSDVAGELEAVADVLEIESPYVPSSDAEDERDRVRESLAVGRELGKRIADKYGPDHAALVEVAFKSNLLMAVAASRPHLKHAISSSVASAAVRAGLPESIWQPLQDRIAESTTPSEIANAVVDLHNQLGSYFDSGAVGDDLDESLMR